MTTLEPGDGSAFGRYFSGQGTQTMVHPVEPAVEPLLDPYQVSPEEARHGDDYRRGDPIRDGLHALTVP